MFKYIWSDRRGSLLQGRMWMMAYIYFNTRVLDRSRPIPEEEFEDFVAMMEGAAALTLRAAVAEAGPSEGAGAE